MSKMPVRLSESGHFTVRTIRAVLLSTSLITSCLLYAQTPYEEGWKHFTSGNYAIARSIWLPLAEKGDADAALGLAIIFENGLQTDRDPQQSVRWYKIAANNGIAEAQHDLGIKYFTGNGVPRDIKKTYSLWKSAAETGLGTAQSKLAYLYLNGIGTEKNEKQALRWYRQAANQGNTEAMYNLSLMYKQGNGTKVNTHQFLYWLEHAAEQDYAPAQYDLGLMKLYGKNVDRSVSQGKDWLGRSAANGYVEAQYYLGTLLMNGHILRPDKEEAIQLLNLAANQGHTGARQALLDIEHMNFSDNTGATRPPVVPATGKDPGKPNRSVTSSTPKDSVVLNSNLVHSSQNKKQSQPAVTASDNSWLSRQNPGHYCIQLLASKDMPSIRRFLKDLPADIKTFTYTYTVKGDKWTAVATGIYSSYEAATSASKQLPGKLARIKPWVRNIGLIQKLSAKQQ